MENTKEDLKIYLSINFLFNAHSDYKNILNNNKYFNNKNNSINNLIYLEQLLYGISNNLVQRIGGEPKLNALKSELKTELIKAKNNLEWVKEGTSGNGQLGGGNYTSSGSEGVTSPRGEGGTSEFFSIQSGTVAVSKGGTNKTPNKGGGSQSQGSGSQPLMPNTFPFGSQEVYGRPSPGSQPSQGSQGPQGSQGSQGSLRGFETPPRGRQ
tara:strand:+ start:820 stop:1449 length:630 start_codon:yes stop_codon:yes gene_type:complete